MTSQFLDELSPAPAPADTRYIWATVTQATPLRVRVDGDTAALAATPDDMSLSHRPVGQRVYCMLQGRRLIVLGPNGLPPGSVIEYAGPAAPPGWLRCDGSNVSRVTYAALFAAVGTLYGAGNGSTTFALPSGTPGAVSQMFIIKV